jgi:hypothetical protein
MKLRTTSLARLAVRVQRTHPSTVRHSLLVVGIVLIIPLNSSIQASALRSRASNATKTSRSGCSPTCDGSKAR